MSWIDGVMGLTEDSVDLCWIHGLRTGVGCGADSVVHADEVEDEVAGDRTSASPRDHRVQRL